MLNSLTLPDNQPMLKKSYGVDGTMHLAAHSHIPSAPPAAPSNRVPVRAWAPRAIAVLSCALALLAAQPGGTTATGTSGEHVHLKSGGASLLTRTTPADTKRSS